MADRQYSVEGDRGREAGQGNGGKRREAGVERGREAGEKFKANFCH